MFKMIDLINFHNIAIIVFLMKLIMYRALRKILFILNLKLVKRIL